jgi:hypothetical protein
MIVRFAILLTIAACSWAQPKIEIHDVPGQASDRLKETGRRLQILRKSPWRSMSAAEEFALAQPVAKLYRANLLPEINSEPQIATFTDRGSDILLARWTAMDERSLFPELLVWDTPTDTSFIFRLAAGSWSTDASITSTFGRLLLPAIPDERPLSAEGIVLNIGFDPHTQQRTGFGTFLERPIPRQMAVEPFARLDLWVTTTANFLSVSFSTRATPDFPPNMRGIAERFPPLESRVVEWTTRHILDDLRAVGERGRDRVLARELMKRDARPDELLAVLEERWQRENGELLLAVLEAHQTRRYADAIRRYLPRDSGMDAMSLTPHPFDLVGRTSEVNFTDVALGVLRQDPLSTAAFRYALANGTTPADYRVLKDLQHPEYSQLRRDPDLRRMRERLGLNEDGDPLPAK